jgi:N-acetylmuramoyl-L-alanine amidase
MSYVLNNSLKAKSISYGNPRSANQIKYLVYHYTGNANDTAYSNARYFATTNTKSAGAHYFVDDTSVYQSIDDLKVAWSVGGSKYSDCSKTGGGKMYKVVTNTNSISIEMCSKNGVITDATIQNAVELGKKLMSKYNIPIGNVYRHFDVNGKHCPAWNGWIDSTAPKWHDLLLRLNGKTKIDVPSPVLKRGAKGDEVKKLQNCLNHFGYNIAVDGSFGGGTETALKNWQSKNGLVADGSYGNKSYQKMLSLLA